VAWLRLFSITIETVVGVVAYDLITLVALGLVVRWWRVRERRYGLILFLVLAIPLAMTTTIGLFNSEVADVLTILLILLWSITL
jgi:hypothetical protein